MPIPLTIAFEDVIHEYLIYKILDQFPKKFKVDSVRNAQGFGQLKKNMAIFNKVAKYKPYLVLTDLDRIECPPSLYHSWLPNGPSPGMIFRIAVREAEAWLLAHREAMGIFFSISKTKIPLNVDEIDDPKQLLVNLARQSKKKIIKFGIPPKEGSTATIGKEYNSLMTEWIYKYWDPNIARTHSQSLHRTMSRWIDSTCPQPETQYFHHTYMKTQHRFLPHLSHDELAAKQAAGLNWTLRHAFAGNPMYRERLAGAGYDPDRTVSLDDLPDLPMTSVDDLRQGYPLPLLSVPEEQVVRIHASSGTTGKRKILAYTQADIDTWKDMFARCYELAGLTVLDRVQIAVGYGLWTAGAGFQLGCERFGAMAVPVGPGNLEIHLQLLEDVGSTVLCSTASMALLMAEEVEKRHLQKKIGLKKAIFGAETHTPRMRQRFQDMLGITESFDIVGMTELYGPGTGLECQAHEGVHYWADYYIMEIVDPETLRPVAPGQVGEMVVTSLCKEAAPLIRYRTRDLTRLIPGDCPCGLSLPRHDRIMGRSDDMVIFRGVNIYPGQIGEVIGHFPELGSEFRVQLFRKGGKDQMLLQVERLAGADPAMDQNLSEAVSDALRRNLLVRCWVEVVGQGELPRSFAKTKRVQDDREAKESCSISVPGAGRWGRR